MTPAWTQLPAGIAAEIVASLTAQIPQIETERLILRACKISDWSVLEPIWTTDRAKYIGGPMTGEDAWLDFNQCVASWMLRGTGPLTITLKGSDTPLGLVLIASEYGDPSPELGWLMTAEAEGKGYATEAAAALRNWGFDVLGKAGFASFITKDNGASNRVAEKLGAKPGPDHPGHKGVRIWLYDDFDDEDEDDWDEGDMS